MKGIQTEYIELQDGTVKWNEWESILGRLDAVADEINRALNWTTSIEEPGSGARNPLKEGYHEIEYEGQGGRRVSRSKGHS